MIKWHSFYVVLFMWVALVDCLFLTHLRSVFFIFYDNIVRWRHMSDFQFTSIYRQSSVKKLASPKRKFYKVNGTRTVYIFNFIPLVGPPFMCPLAVKLLNNRLYILRVVSTKINLEWLNDSFDSYTVKCKKLFLNKLSE